MTNNPEQISGIFVSLSKEEAEGLYEFLEAAGYTADAGGLKEYVFDSIEEEADNPARERNERLDTSINNIIDMVSKNPEMIRQGIHTAGNLFASVKEHLKKRPFTDR